MSNNMSNNSPIVHIKPKKFRINKKKKLIEKKNRNFPSLAVLISQVLSLQKL